MMYVKIPKERIGVLIGHEGATKREVEVRTGVKIDVDSRTGDVLIDDSGADPVMALRVRDFVKAVARGFSPERAERLIDEEDTYLEIIDIKEFSGKSENRMRVLKGRIIGTRGKTRRYIEHLSGAEISVYGHTVAIIGTYEQLEMAKKAIEMLLQGSKHATAYRFLERKRREMKYAALDYYVHAEHD